MKYICNYNLICIYGIINKKTIVPEPIKKLLPSKKLIPIKPYIKYFSWIICNICSLLIYLSSAWYTMSF